MSKPSNTPSYLTNQDDDDLIAPLPRVLQGGLLRMGTVLPPPVTPLLLSATPADNSGTVGVSNAIVLHFNTDVQAGSGSIVISDGRTQSYIDSSGALASRIVGATDTRTLSLSDPQVTISGQDVTIHLSTPMKTGTGYSVTMAAGVLTDTSASHVSYAGLANTSLLNFTTSAAHAAPTAVIDDTIHFTDTGSSSSDYITNSAAQTLSGSYSGTLQTGDFVQVSLDNGASWHQANASGGAWNYSGTSISASSTMLARISNIYGLNSGSADEAYTYSVDKPSAYASNLMFSADTGSSSADRITSSAAQTISGTVVGTLAAGERLQVSLDNGVSWHDATLTGGGTAWSYATTLNAGTNLLRVQVADVAGNVFEASQYSYSLHTSAYNLSAGSIKVAPSSDSNIVGDNITNIVTKITVNGLSNGGLHAGDTINIIDQSNGNAIVGSYTLNSSNVDHYGNGFFENGYGTAVNSWDVDVTGLGNGSHVLAAQVVDTLAGLTGIISPSVTVSVDTIAPVLSSVAHTDTDSNAGTPDDIVLTFSESVGIASGTSFLISDGNSANDKTLTLAGTGTGQVTVSGNTVTLHMSGSLDPSATYTITLNGPAITDIAGNAVSFNSGDNTMVRFTTDSSTHVTTAVIAMAPVTAAVSGALALSNDSGTNNHDFITNAATQTISGSYTGTLVGDQTVQVSTDGGASWHNATPDPGTHTWSYNGTLAVGNNTLSARVADSSGSFTAPVSQSYTYDNTAPSESLAGATLALHPSYDSGATGDGLTNVATAHLNVSGLATLHPAVGDLLQIVDVNHGSAVVGTYQILSTDLDHYGVMLNNSMEITTDAALSDGVHQLALQFGDTAGNSATASNAVAFTIDTTAPTASMASATLQLAAGEDTGASSADNLINQQHPKISVNLSGVTGMHAGEIIQILNNAEGVAGSYVLQASDLDGTGALVAASKLLPDITLTQALSESSHDLRVQLVDPAGNLGTVSSTALTVTVDLTAPTVQSSVPTDVSGIVSSANPGNIVLTFNDNVDIRPFASVVISDGITAHDQTLTVEGGQISIVGHTMTIHIPGSLDPSKSNYTATLSGSDITDMAGNVVIADNALFLHFNTDSGVPAAAPQIVASQTVPFSTGSSVTVSGHYTTTSISANDIIEVTLDQGVTWTTPVPTNHITSPGNGDWSVFIPTLNGAIGVRIEDWLHTVSHPMDGATDHGAVPIYFMPSNGGTFTSVTDNTVIYGGSGNDNITVANDAYVDGGAGADTIVAGDHSFVLAGEHANVTLGSGSTVEATGDYLTLHTDSGSHSIIMNTLSGLNTAQIVGSGSNDTLDIDFYGNSFNLHDVSAPSHISGIEGILLGAAGNTITIGSASDVTAFAGGNTLSIQSVVGGNQIYVNMSIWQLDSTDANYRTYHVIGDPTIALLVGVNIGNGAA